MEEPENMVANWTCGYGNIPHASSRDNAPVHASGDCTGGLASCQATTSWRMPGWNCLKHRDCIPAGMQLQVSGCAETLPRGRRQHPASNSGVCDAGAPRCIDSGMAAETGMQNREGACTISTTPISVSEMAYNRVHGLADEAAVAVTPVIINWKSEGPLDHDCLSEKEEGRGLPIGLSTPAARDGLLIEQSQIHRLCRHTLHPSMKGEMYSKPQGKAVHDRHGHDLKPYWGNPAVRNFRGADGNGNIGAVPPEVHGTSGMIWNITSMVLTAPSVYSARMKPTTQIKKELQDNLV